MRCIGWRVKARVCEGGIEEREISSDPVTLKVLEYGWGLSLTVELR